MYDRARAGPEETSALREEVAPTPRLPLLLPCPRPACTVVWRGAPCNRRQRRLICFPGGSAQHRQCLTKGSCSTAVSSWDIRGQQQKETLASGRVQEGRNGRVCVITQSTAVVSGVTGDGRVCVITQSTTVISSVTGQLGPGRKKTETGKKETWKGSVGRPL